MATAKLTPSGNYRCQVYIGIDEEGKKKYKTFTDPDKRRCERKASEYADQHRQARSSGTVGYGIESYISLKKAVLSPSTVRGYEVTKRYFFESHRAFCERRMASLDKDALQKLVNDMSKEFKPKTVRNRYALITAVLEHNDIYIPKVHLPEKVKPDLKIPDTNDIKNILKEVKGTEMEIPVLLGAYAGMRRSEICALSIDDIKGNTIHVHHALVPNSDNKYVLKSTKTLDGDRYIPVKKEIVDLIRKQGYVTEFKNPNIITSRFEHIVRRAGCPGVRFHDLRHWHASFLHSKNIPDVIIKSRCGWRSDSVMKDVYRHELESERHKWNIELNKKLPKI